MMRALPAALCCALTLAAVPAARGDGRGIGYAAAGPVFDLPAGIGVERLEVRISIHSVRLTYVFRASRRQTVHFDFVMPDMPVDASPDAIGIAGGGEAAGLAADAYPANYLDLSVRVNERPLALAGHGRALHDGKDVTRRLLDAGVPLLYDLDGEAPWRGLSPEVRAMLEADGLLDLDAALWSYQASFAWDATFEPGETRVEVRYAPVADYWSDITLGAFSEIEPGGPATRAYCIDDALRRAFYRDSAYELYTVTHLTAPADGWRGPVGHYRLVVDKGVPANLVAFCPLAAKKTSPATFEWTATDFTPGGETGVLFFVNPEAASSAGQDR